MSDLPMQIDRALESLEKRPAPHLVFFDDTRRLRVVPYRAVVGFYDHRANPDDFGLDVLEAATQAKTEEV